MQGHLRIINSGKDMDNCFNNFFCQKILNIHDDLTSITLTHGMPLVEKSCMPIIHTFEHIAETDIRQLLKRSFIDLCAVDSMPTWIMKDYLEVLINSITNIIKKSLSLGVFPRPRKAALVKPLLKNTV